MQFLQLFTLARLLIAIYAQICPDTEIAFLFDQSENARAASTNGSHNFTIRFHILREQVTIALKNSRILNTPSYVNIRIGGYGYSNDVMSVIPPGSSPAAAIDSLVNGLFLISNGGSWTYRGLHGITSGPTYTNNRLIVISSQGSGNTNRRLLAQLEAQRVRSLGWNITVIAVKGKHAIDLQELTVVKNNQPPILINDTTNTTDPKSYRLLQPELDNIINSLCNVSPTC
ncbi:unnamed protein product [Lymnaea stagnalis]|uniref:VWFA domain-containing protein n=1 Tax=Lymnaea stagnalis TaxID=6523 RepID=A0AAV2HUE0_LYMST